MAARHLLLKRLCERFLLPPVVEKHGGVLAHPRPHHVEVDVLRGLVGEFMENKSNIER
jgi:hypothetical protein